MAGLLGQTDTPSYANLSPPSSVFPAYIVIKCVPFISYYLILAYLRDPGFSLVLFFVSELIEFWIVKSWCGWHLIGITWFVEPDDSGALIQFAAKPSPFIPSFSLANIFWIGFFLSLIGWGFLLLLALVRGAFLSFFLALAGFAMEALNLTMFMRGHSSTQRQAAMIVRAGIFEGAVHFADVRDEDSDAKASNAFDSSDLSET
jgi:hypothetical protein